MDDRSWQCSPESSSCVAISSLPLANSSLNSTASMTSLGGSSSSSEQSHLHILNSLAESNSRISKQNEVLIQELVEVRSQLSKKSDDLAKTQSENAKLRIEGEKKLRRIKPDVSRQLKALYESLNEDEQFKPQRELSDDENKLVYTQLESMMSEQGFDSQDIAFGIKRKFYQLQKNRKEDDDTPITRRRTGRRHLKYNTRKSTAEQHNLHNELMNTLNVNDMSDEESMNGDLFKVKKPTWRTNEQDVSLKELDNMGQRKSNKRKKRIVGSPSVRVKRTSRNMLQ
jgi:hypothetical protein